MGLGAILDAFSIAGSSNTQGGRLGWIEIHSQALFTADKTTGRPIPRLLAEHPTLDNGGLRIRDDGTMVATYRLRHDVKWADGVPLTSRDLMFTYRMTQERSVPIIDIGPSTLMESAAAPDDLTFIIIWKQPYYMADAIGLRAFWPMPAHLLERDFDALVIEQKDSASFLAKPFWTTEYVHVGPFKVTQFVPGEDVVLDAVDHYFLGRPRVDRIIVRQIADPGTIYANVIAGAIDLGTDNVLAGDRALELKTRWDADGRGQVYFGTGTTQFFAFQFDRTVASHNSVILDKRVRHALYHAVDRDQYAEVITGVPGKAANALLPPDNALYPYVKDGYKERFPHDLNRSLAAFEQAGWRRGTDGLLSNAAGERVKVVIRVGQGSENRGTMINDMWHRVGVDSEMVVSHPARTADREYLQSFPGGEIVGRGSQDAILTRLECGEMPTAQNRWSGNNRGHWCHPEYERLVPEYRTSLREERRGELIKQVQELLLEELPLLLLNVNVATVFARRAVTAFRDDFAGGSEAGRLYGTYSRNAHEWNVEVL
jgi:peptide/nickel transport system substrate-binding protein